MSNIPTIAMIPSAYKAGKVYSVLPTNGDADLDFTRAGTATRVNNINLIEEMATGVPRLDYSDGGCPSLLLEPQSTNELTQSNTSDFNLVRSTRGTQSNKLGIVDGYEYSFSSADPNINKLYTESTLGYKTFSVYFDSTNSDECRLVLATGGAVTNGADVTFTPSTETFGSITENATYVRNSSSGFENMGNGIYRVWLTTEFILYIGVTTFAVLYFGDNTNVWMGGFQVEKLSYATSYIPTDGTTATRVAETVSKTGLENYINSSEGVLFAEVNSNSKGLNPLITISDGSSSNRVNLGFTGDLLFGRVTNPTDDASITSAIIPENYNKIAIRWSGSEFSIWANGSELNTSVLTDLCINMDRIGFDNGSASANFYYGKVKDLRVYNQALTDEQLQTLTT